MTPGARGERREPTASMGMPGTELRDQLPGAGAGSGERARDDKGQRVARH